MLKNRKDSESILEELLRLRQNFSGKVLFCFHVKL